MADRIKGITIELDGETTGLKKALSSVTQESISIQKELTDVNRLLKFDPGNASALAQKQELLSKQIENTSQKLKALKDAQSQVDAQFSKGEIGEQQYRAFQREIEFTEASLNKFKNSYKDAMNPPTSGDLAKPVKDLEQEVEKSKGVFDNMGEYIKRGIGLAIGGDIWDKAKEGFGELVTFGGDWQKSLNTLQAQTGATSEEMAKFNEQIEAVYNNNFGSSVEDVAESFSEVRQYMQGTGEDLQGVTQNAIAFRDTFGVEVPESMRSVQALMKQFGLTSEEAFNLLAQGQQQGLNFSDELFDSINEYGVQFDKLGLSATDMFNIFKSGADAGAFNLDKVGDAVKELSIRVIDGSTTTQDGFNKLGLNADDMAKKFGAGGDSAKQAFYQVIQGLKDMDDPVAQSIAGVDLFGTQWEDLGPQVVTSLGSVQGAFDQTKDSMEQINEVKYNTPIEALDGLGRQIKTSVLLPVSQELMPTLNDAAKQLSETFSSSDLKSGIESLSQGLGELIKAIADIAANVLPSLLTGLGWIMDNSSVIATGIVAIGTAMEVFKVATLVNDFVGKIQKAQKATEGLSIAQATLNVIMDANPIGLIVAAVAGLVAAIVYLWNTNETFRDAVIGAWNTISDTASQVWNGIVTFFTETIPNAFSSLGNFFTSTVPQMFSDLWTTITTAFTDGWNGVVTFFTESVPNWLSSMGSWFASLPNAIAYGLGEAIGNIVKWGTDTYSYLSTNVPIWISSIGQWFSALPGNIWTWLVNTITNIQTWGSNMLTEATTAASNTYNAVINWFTQLPGGIETWLSNCVTNVTTWGSNMLTEAETGMTNVFNGIVDTFTSLPSRMTEIGTNIVAGIKQGISDAWEGMKGWIGGLCDSFINGVKEKMDIHSPSRVMRKLGVYTGEGFGLGIGDTIGSISRQANALAQAAIPNVNAGSFDMGLNASRGGIRSSSNLDRILSTMDSMRNEIASLKDALNLTVNLDGQKVGKIITPVVSSKLAFSNGRKGY